MCHQREGEKSFAFFVRMFKENPGSFFVVVCLLATSWLYYDQQKANHEYMDSMQNLMQEQTKAYVENAKAIQELSIRLQNLETNLRQRYDSGRN